jgi:hypothetical protein
VQKLAKKFIAVGAEVSLLESGKGKASELFRELCKKGHYANGITKQGTYLFTPAGELLASGNSQDVKATVELMQSALKKYADLPKAKRVPEKPLFARPKEVKPVSPLYPENGLILDVSLRKLFAKPPKTDQEKYRNVEWNQDHAWFRNEEARKWMPATVKVGESAEVPAELVERLARFHLLDTTRALSAPYPKNSVKEAKMIARITALKDEVVVVELEGSIHLSQSGLPPSAKSTDSTFPVPQKPDRAYQAKLLGRAKYDTRKQAFTEFELVALGTKSGGGRFSVEDPVTMGVAFTLAGRGIPDQVEPRYLDQYGWQSRR